MIYTPFVINFKYWLELLNSPNDKVAVNRFFFFDIMNRLKPSIYSTPPRRVIKAQ